MAWSTATRSTTPSTDPFSTAATGRSLPAMTGIASLIVIVTSSGGPQLLARLGLPHDPAQREDVAARDVAHEVRHVVVGGRTDDLLRRAELDDRAVAHDRDPVAETERLRQVVRDEDHRLARLLLEPADLVLHVAADERVERAERLVVEHHRRVGRERARDADALLHPAGQLVGELLLHVFQADELQQLAGTGEPLALRHSADLEPERDVVDHAPVREQPEVLEDHRDRVAAQLAQLCRTGCRHVLATDPDRSRRRLDQPDERADERRLPRAREPHHDEDLARPDVERHVPDGGDAAGLLAERRPRQLRVRGPEDAVRLRAEDLPDPRGRDERLTGTAGAVLHPADISACRGPVQHRERPLASGTRAMR